MLSHFLFVRNLAEKKKKSVRTFPPLFAYSSGMPQRKIQETERPDPLLSPSAPLPAPLSPHWAFVVQLRQGTALTPEGMQGRIEHIVSGQAATFSSLEEARAFMERVLAEMAEEKPP